MSGQATDNLEENAREKPLIPLPFCFSNAYLNNSSLFQLSLRTLWTSPSTKLSLRTVIRLFEKRHKRLVGKYQEILYGTYCCLVYQKMKKYPRSWAIPRTSFHLSFCHLWRQNKCGCPEQRRNKTEHVRFPQNQSQGFRLWSQLPYPNSKSTEAEAKGAGCSSPAIMKHILTNCRTLASRVVSAGQEHWIIPETRFAMNYSHSLLASESRETGRAGGEMCIWRLLMENPAWVH